MMTTAVQLFLVACIAMPAVAQQIRPYVGATTGTAPLEPPQHGDFPLDRGIENWITVGIAVGENHAIELSGASMDASTTEAWNFQSGSEAPYTITFRATPIVLAYRYRFPCGAGPIRPEASIGGVWAPVEDTWMSDTDPSGSSSWVYGLTAMFGLAADLPGPVALVVRGGYMRTRGASGRYQGGIRLGGAVANAGIVLGI